MKNNLDKNFGVIVVGGGHAGIEAAHSAAKLGSKTLLVTLKIDKIGLMPCNPAIGGIGKGHIVFEISALGGLMPKLCTKTYLQAKMLNTRKGPAVQGLRLQIDKVAYNKLSKETLQNIENLTLLEERVDDIVLDNNQVTGIKVSSGEIYNSPTVILTTGTFLNGLTHVGHEQKSAGRVDEESVKTLSDFLKNTAKLNMGRLKTGTPPRLLSSSIDYSKMEYQGSDDLNYLYEFEPHQVEHKKACYITRTNTQTHDILKNNFEKSPIFTGNIKGTPPRYCPSIEDKISRFPDKESHHVFVEPESAFNEEVYPNGLSTSMPAEVQELYIRSISGFENAKFARYGYAVEYDFVYPNQLKHSLETKKISGLFLAGQLNGTTGYEEAAGQGLIAGINAHLKVNNKEEFILNRTESYIGIMIDDLVTMSVDEPYRMFTSRAERRLLLRQDNVFNRLSGKAYNLGLIDQELYNKILAEQELVSSTIEKLKADKANKDIAQLITNGQTEEVFNRIIKASDNKINLKDRALQTVYADILYGPYLKREQKEVEKAHYYQSLDIPAELELKNIPGLSTELQQKINKYNPKNIAQAALIPGMTPAAVSLLIFKIRELKEKQN